MNMHKIGVIVWTIDPEGNRRFLLRHNKPFNGREDEWTIVFGGVEEDENYSETAVREVREEFGINVSETVDLEYTVVFENDKGKNIIHFYACKVDNINVKVTLNEESIGYDWMTLDGVMEVMKYDDEKKAFDKINNVN